MLKNCCISALADSTAEWLGSRPAYPCPSRDWGQTRCFPDSLEFYTSIVDNAHSTFVARPRDLNHGKALLDWRKTDTISASFVDDLDDTFVFE